MCRLYDACQMWIFNDIIADTERCTLVSQVYRARARICKRLWSPGIDSEESIPSAYVAWRASTTNRVVVPTHQAGNRFLGSLKGLKYGLSLVFIYMLLSSHVFRSRSGFKCGSGSKETRIRCAVKLQLTGGFSCAYFIQHCFICRTPHLRFRGLCRRMLASNTGLWNRQSDALITQLVEMDELT